MIQTLLTKLVMRFEKTLGVGLPYLHAVVADAPGALVPIGLSMPASSYGQVVPAPVLHMVRLGATQALDCGECLQIAVNLAVKDSLEADDIRAALDGRLDHLSPEYAEAFEFGRLASGQPVPLETREAIRMRYSDRGLIEASMAASGAQFFPVLKRGMGYADACDLDALHFDLDSRAAA